MSKPVSNRREAVVVGAGPNGLAAAIELARNGVEVLVIEGNHEIGGGTRTAELTLPGFHHDVCSAAHSFGPSSPFLSDLPLGDHGLTWVTPPAAVAHPFDDGSAVLLESEVTETAASLGSDGAPGSDGATYRSIVEPFVDRFDDLAEGLLGPLVRPPRNPLLLARFGRHGVQSAERFARRFTTVRARGFFAGLASHGVLPLGRRGTTGAGLALGIAGHHNGWPIVRGGSHQLTRAMASYLVSLGGRIETGRWIGSLDEVGGAGAVLLDITPAQLVALAGDELPALRRRRFEGWEYGPATFKVDFALSDPVPWKAPEVARTATVHLGNTFEEIAAGEGAAWDGRLDPRPFVLVTQPSLFDDTRAPAGRHTLWAYCHVPQGFDGDATDAIEGQIERFAPGFRETVLARHTMGPADFERYNPNNVGGSIAGGAVTLGQLFARPFPTPWPYVTGIDDVYLCSSATSPGAGAHGMCGYHAARTALRTSFR